MTRLTWDQVGERRFETGVDRGVFYVQDISGTYDPGQVWNGLYTVTESPTGAEQSAQYADNSKYANLTSPEEFAGTIESYDQPIGFAKCDGSAAFLPGFNIGQQPRHPFGFCYRTRVGNDEEGSDFGYKIHLIYGALAGPAEKVYATQNDSPEAITFSWEITTTPVRLPGYNPTSHVTIDSTAMDPEILANLEAILYGTATLTPRFPSIIEILSFVDNFDPQLIIPDAIGGLSLLTPGSGDLTGSEVPGLFVELPASTRLTETGVPGTFILDI